MYSTFLHVVYYQNIFRIKAHCRHMQHLVDMTRSKYLSPHASFHFVPESYVQTSYQQFSIVFH